MGKKPNQKASAAKGGPTLSTEVAEQVKKMRTDADMQFLKKEYNKAIDFYEKAAKLIPDGVKEKSEILSNKAACCLQQSRFKDAIKDCNAALVSNPNHRQAYILRSAAYEQQGLYKQALSDIQVVNKTDGATADTKAAETRLREILSGKRTGAAPAPSSSTAVRPGAKASTNSQAAYYFSAKCTLGDDTKLVHMPYTVNYADMLEQVQAKFPNAGPFVMKFVDKDGDLVTLTCREDLHAAMTEVMTVYHKSMAGGQHSQKLSGMPPIKVQLVPVASEADVPKPPPQEVAEKAQEQQKRAEAAAKAASGNTEADEWLVEFATLFRDLTGIDSDRHIDLYNIGWETCSKAMAATVTSDEAVPLFDKSMARFKEVTAVGLLNWGNVHMCLAHKYMEDLVAKPEDKDASAKVRQQLDEAQRRFDESLSYKSDFFDGLCALAQLQFERAKMEAGLYVPTPKTTDADENQDAAQATLSASLKEALAKLKKVDVDKAAAHILRAGEYFSKAIEAAPAAEEREKEDAADRGDEPVNAEINFKNQATIMHGNVMYEWSQILAAVGEEWRSSLDQAKAMFEEAGCKAVDIRNALKNHTMRDEIDLGPEPEPEVQAAVPVLEQPKPAAPAQEEKKAKGLPSLEVKRKK